MFLMCIIALRRIWRPAEYYSLRGLIEFVAISLPVSATSATSATQFKNKGFPRNFAATEALHVAEM